MCRFPYAGSAAQPDTVTVEGEIGVPADAPHGTYEILLSLNEPARISSLHFFSGF